MAVKKKVNFYRCDACRHNYADIGIKAPKNKYKFNIVCSKCFKNYFGTHSPVPSTAAQHLQNNLGSFLPFGKVGIISTDGASLINQDGASLINQDGASLISNKGGGILTNASSNLINQDGASFGRRS